MIDPLRSALHEVYSLPIRDGVFRAAIMLVNCSLKIIDIKSQINFLLDCKRERILPPSLLNLKLPHFQSIISSRADKENNQYKLRMLKLYISDRYQLLNSHNVKIKDSNFYLSVHANYRQIRAVNRILNTYSDMQRKYSEGKHSRKHANCVGQKRSTCNNNSRYHDNTEGAGVVCYTAREFSNDVIPVLNLGGNFAPTPSSVPKVNHEIRVSLAHLAYKLRNCDHYAAKQPSAAPSSRGEATPSLQPIMHKVDKKCYPVLPASQETESKLDKLNKAMDFHCRDLKKHLPLLI